LKACSVVLKDVSKNRNPLIKRWYRSALDNNIDNRTDRRVVKRSASSVAEDLKLEGIRSMVEEGSKVSVNASKLSSMFEELALLRAFKRKVDASKYAEVETLRSTLRTVKAASASTQRLYEDTTQRLQATLPELTRANAEAAEAKRAAQEAHVDEQLLKKLMADNEQLQDRNRDLYLGRAAAEADGEKLPECEPPPLRHADLSFVSPHGHRLLDMSVVRRALTEAQQCQCLGTIRVPSDKVAALSLWELPRAAYTVDLTTTLAFVCSTCQKATAFYTSSISDKAPKNFCVNKKFNSLGWDSPNS
jgi:hypothetical protein